MNPLIQLPAALLGSLGFGALFNLHGRKLAFAALGGLLSWSIYLLVERFSDIPYLCAFIASVSLTLYAEAMARIHKTPVTVFLVTAAIPLIPGAGLYRSASALMLKQMDTFADQGLYTLLFAASMSAGVTLTTLLFQLALTGMRRGKFS
ncbi:MAG: threonine/serine exporter family protein [Candidatus Faecivicinus sp.]